MEPQQYDLMDRVETRHWWYLGLRDLLARCWRRPEMALETSPIVLDAGCGTGGNLQFFSQLLTPGYLGGFDNSPLALAAAERKCPGADLYASDICAPTLHRERFDLIFSCDVVYVPGLVAARPGLIKLVEHLKPGGQFVLHLPAYNWLKSHHDQAVHTRERYVLGQVKRLMADLNLQCLRASYRLCPLLPLIVLRRMPSLLSRRTDRASNDLVLPPAWLNRWLTTVMRAENLCIARGMSMPWGSSIIAIGKRPT